MILPGETRIWDRRAVLVWGPPGGPRHYEGLPARDENRAAWRSLDWALAGRLSSAPNAERDGDGRWARYLCRDNHCQTPPNLDRQGHAFRPFKERAQNQSSGSEKNRQTPRPSTGGRAASGREELDKAEASRSINLQTRPRQPSEKRQRETTTGDHCERRLPKAAARGECEERQQKAIARGNCERQLREKTAKSRTNAEQGDHRPGQD